MKKRAASLTIGLMGFLTACAGGPTSVVSAEARLEIEQPGGTPASNAAQTDSANAERAGGHGYGSGN